MYVCIWVMICYVVSDQFEGIVRGQWDTNRCTAVADQASKLQVTLMLAEGTMLHGLSHNNVLPVLAASLDSLKQPLLVYPYSNKGNLKR